MRTFGLIMLLFSFCLGIGLAYLTTPENIVVNSKDSLYQTIESKKDDYEWPAEDAKIDPVWKKTPGIMGRTIDVEASYKKMKKGGEFDPKLLVYKKIKPKVSLEDLPPSPIYRGHPKKEMVSLLINVSWGEEYIPEMIKVLSKQQVKATFFIDGAFAKKFTNLVQMIEEEGHTIGSHGYMHKKMGRMSKEQAIDNLEQANDILFALTNVDINYFAPPAGSFNGATVEASEELDMKTILWTVDTIDWKQPTREVMIERVMDHIHKGATILMHPTKVTVESLPEMIKNIKKKYQIVALPKLLSEERS